MAAGDGVQLDLHARHFSSRRCAPPPRCPCSSRPWSG
jgi:hypothetical protein